MNLIPNIYVHTVEPLKAGSLKNKLSLQKKKWHFLTCLKYPKLDTYFLHFWATG